MNRSLRIIVFIAGKQKDFLHIAERRKDLNASAETFVDANKPFNLVFVQQFGKKY
jgi:hypothetical protein